MAKFVLVHGGGHGGWCYGKVAKRLRESGHEVFTPTLTGLCERRHLLTAGTGLSTHIEDVVNLLVYEGIEDAVLAGHSYGGMVITGVADRVPERIRELVFLDAAHPRDGQALVDTAPEMMAYARSSSRTVDGVELVMWPDDQLIAVLGVTDPDDVSVLKERLCPHPWKAFEEKLVCINGDAAWRLPRTNVNCTENLARSTPERLALQTEGHRNFEIDTGHNLMMTEPDRVTEMLLEVAAG